MVCVICSVPPRNSIVDAHADTQIVFDFDVYTYGFFHFETCREKKKPTIYGESVTSSEWRQQKKINRLSTRRKKIIATFYK